jgi:hypothetical protein
MVLFCLLSEPTECTIGARCLCGTPAHEATGWVLQIDPLVILCGPCARDFAKWYKGRVKNPIGEAASERLVSDGTFEKRELETLD